MYNHKNPYYKNCIHCGKESNGKPYCYDCYIKYYKMSSEANEALYNSNTQNDICMINDLSKKYPIKRNCAYCGKELENLTICPDCKVKYLNPQKYHLNYNPNISTAKTYKLKNGIEVKSKSELLIGNFLINHHINFEYEKPLSYSPNRTPLKPDFYIEGPRYFKGRWLKNIYIEHLGGAQSSDPEEQKRYQNTVKYKMPIYKHEQITLICTYEEDIENLEEILTKKLKYCSIGIINYFKES